jgi:DNA-binding transcriptional LysR family regulator
MTLEPNDLGLFARVVEEGSFSRAARRAGIPVSTASRRITSLENLLGERLLQRTTRKLTVTELGHALFEHAKQVLENVDAAAALADHRQLEPSGKLRVSMPADFWIIGPFLADFLSHYPAVSLDLDLSMRVVDLVGEGFDLALRFGPLANESTLAARRIAELTGGLYASPAYVKKHGAPTAPEDLLQHTALNGGGGEPLKWKLQRGSDQWEGVPPTRVTANSPEMLMRMALLGAGIALAEDRAAHPYVEAGELVRILPEWEFLHATIWAVFPSRKLMPAKTRVFLDELAAYIESPQKKR